MNQLKLDKRLQECYRQLVNMGYNVKVISPKEIKITVEKDAEPNPKTKSKTKTT